MKITIEIDEKKINRIKERLEYYNTMMDHPELLTEKDQEITFQQWRGARFILRNLGIEL